MTTIDDIRLAAFILLSTTWVLFSWRTLFHPRSHGFYRFLALEAITALLLWNLPYWFANPFSITQTLSWLLLLASLLVLWGGVNRLRMARRSVRQGESTLFAFERTSELVTSGIYRYIRHPMYASLLYLAWGTFFKEISEVSMILMLAATASLFATALADERECIQYFGRSYRDYMKNSKRFIPFVL